MKLPNFLKFWKCLVRTTSSPCTKRNSISITRLPDELILQIFAHLNLHNRLIVGQVCPHWKRLSLMNIDELQIGTVMLPMIRKLQYRLCSVNVTENQTIFSQILQQSNFTLRSVIVGKRDFHYPRQWNRLLPILIENCPNLIEFIVEDNQLCKQISRDDFCKFFQKFGHQLESLVIKEQVPDLFELVITHLNPHRLQELGIRIDSQSQCRQLFQYFHTLKCVHCHFSTLDVISFNNLKNLRKLCWNGDERIRQDRIQSKVNDLIQEGCVLTNLTVLIIDKFISIDPIIITIVDEPQNSLQGLPLQFFQTLHQVRHLMFSPAKIDMLGPMFECQPRLQSLQLNLLDTQMWTIEWKSRLSFDCLPKLKKLRLYFVHFGDVLKYFHYIGKQTMMTSVILLDLKLMNWPNAQQIADLMWPISRMLYNLERLIFIGPRSGHNRSYESESKVLIDYLPAFTKLRHLNVNRNNVTHSLYDYCNRKAIRLNNDDYFFG